MRHNRSELLNLWSTGKKQNGKYSVAKGKKGLVNRHE